MKKSPIKYFIIVSSIFFFFDANCQEWKKYYGQSFDAKVFDLLESYDKGYIFTGSTKKNAYQPQGWLIKTDINGEELWNKKIGDGTYLTFLTGIFQTIDYGYILSGSTDKVSQNRDAFVMKLDACGNKEWCVVYPNNNMLFDDANDIIQNPDGTYTVLVTNYGSNPAEENIWLFKLDQNGSTLWRKLYATDPDYLDEYGHDLITVSGSGVLISGSNWAQVSGYPGLWWWTPLWLKVDLEGNTEWEFYWQEPEYFGGVCGASIEFKNRNFFGAGSNGVNAGVPSIFKFSGDGQQIARYDILGDSIHSGGAYTISAFHDSTTFAIGGAYSPNPDTGISMLWKTDTLGNLIAQRDIPLTAYPPIASLVTHDNKLLVTSYGQYLPPNNTEIILMKFNSDLEYDSIYTRPYTYDSLCNETIVSDTIQLDCDIVVNLDEPMLQPENNLLVFPNPATSRVTIKLPENKMTVEKKHGFEITTIRPLDENLSLEIISLSGRLMLKQEIEKGTRDIEIEVSGWKERIYLVILSGDKGFKATEKLVIAK